MHISSHNLSKFNLKLIAAGNEQVNKGNKMETCPGHYRLLKGSEQNDVQILTSSAGEPTCTVVIEAYVTFNSFDSKPVVLPVCTQ